jgi:hypothetical protein
MDQKGKGNSKEYKHSGFTGQSQSSWTQPSTSYTQQEIEKKREEITKKVADEKQRSKEKAGNNDLRALKMTYGKKGTVALINTRLAEEANLTNNLLHNYAKRKIAK